MKKMKILLYGIGTYKNSGIEAILQSTINQIDKEKYDITVATFDYENNKKKYNKEIFKYVNHYKKADELNEEERKLEDQYKNMPFDYNNFELLYQNEAAKELEKTDICFSTGGDNYCYGGSNWLYALDNLSHKLGKKTVLWGASLFDEIKDNDLKEDLRNFDVLVIRESLTYNAVKKYVPESKIILSSDPAFSLEVKKVKLNKWYEKRNYIVLNVSPLTIINKEQYEEIIKFIDYILEKTKYSICLLPHVKTDDCNDLDILEKLKDNYENEDRIYIEKEEYNCNELKYIISKSKIVVAARTHASIAAYSTFVPTLVIGYSVKSKGIAKDIFGEYENYVISKDNLKNGNLIEKFKYIDKNQENIKDILKEKMPLYKEKAKNLFNEVIEKLKHQEEQRICAEGKCIGCGLCSKLCPKNAIEMVEDEFGFVIPKIDLKKCIHCDICRKNCPINQKCKENTFKKIYYAAKSSDEFAKQQSSSGGIFSVIAEKVLDEKGIVYGCEMKDFKLNHVRITKKEELSRIRGSKYAQSNIKNIFEEVKKDLNNGKKVLFSATPCQVGAIKSFLKKDYDNLLTISVICHGVTNKKIFDKQIKEIEEKENKIIKNVNFRSKYNGWTKASIEYDFDDSKVVNRFIDDNFMNLYLKNIILRESCYNCSYKDKFNQADLILGDYWGIEVVNKDFYDENGVSLLIINSNKGNNFINKNQILDKVKYTDGTEEDTIKYNPLLFESAKIPRERHRLLSLMNTRDFEYINLLCNYLNEKEENDSMKKEVYLLKDDNERLSFELKQIINSKRYRMINKVGKVISKFKRREKK